MKPLIEGPDRAMTFDSFDSFVAARLPALLRTAAALCGDLGLAEDLTQEVLLRVHHRWPQIAALSAPESYVRRMLVNEYLSWWRKWSRITPVAEIIGGDDAPDHADRVTDRDALVGELRRLTGRRRAAVVLRYYGGLSDAEIAAALDCRIGTVRSLISRALTQLRVEPTVRAVYQPSDEHRERTQP